LKCLGKVKKSLKSLIPKVPRSKMVLGKISPKHKLSSSFPKLGSSKQKKKSPKNS